MHELSLAQDVIDRVTNYVIREDLRNVQSVRLRVGIMSGVVSASLAFSYSAITCGTPLERSVLDIEAVPFRIHCRACEQSTTNDLGVSVCGSCGSVDTIVESGYELEVTSIVLNDNLSAVSPNEESNAHTDDRTQRSREE